METKRTKATQKTGEKPLVKPVNQQLLRQMVSLSNNSILTRQTADMLTQKLDENEIKELITWFFHAKRELSK